jgi:hypothetical protein
MKRQHCWLLVLAACGTNHHGATVAKVDPALVDALVSRLYDFDQARARGDGTGGALAITQIQLGAAIVPGPTPPLPSTRVVGETQFAGCVCTAGGCSFTQCGDPNPTTGWTLDGSATLTGGTYTFAVDYSDPTPYTYHLDGSATIAPTTVDAELATTSQCCSDHTQDDDSVRLAHVVVDAQHCAIGGTAHGDVAVATPGDATQTYHVVGDLVLGPTCATSH